MAKFICALESPHYPINKVLINISENQQTVPINGGGCPGILWTFHPLSYLNLSWIKSWATCSNWPCLKQGFGHWCWQWKVTHEPVAYWYFLLIVIVTSVTPQLSLNPTPAYSKTASLENILKLTTNKYVCMCVHIQAHTDTHDSGTFLLFWQGSLSKYCLGNFLSGQPLIFPSQKAVLLFLPPSGATDNCAQYCSQSKVGQISLELNRMYECTQFLN